jgi:hypothetical protein
MPKKKKNINTFIVGMLATVNFLAWSPAAHACLRLDVGDQFRYKGGPLLEVVNERDAARPRLRVSFDRCEHAQIALEMSLEERKSALIREHFLETADGDYLAARWAWDNGRFYNFCWSASQCVEKYLKAALLYDGRSSKGFGHNLNSLFNEVRDRSHLHGKQDCDAFNDGERQGFVGWEIDVKLC